MNEGNGRIVYVEGFALQKGVLQGAFTIGLSPSKSADALKLFVSNLPNTGYPLEQMRNCSIWLYNDGSVKIKIPNNAGQNGHLTQTSINLDDHESRNLATILRDMCAVVQTGAPFEYNREAQNRLEEFIGKYS